MLLRLYIKNLVLVESCEILLQPGFTVITGETGSGKSIILSSLSLLLGSKQETSLIRQGASSSIVEATFLVPKILPILEEAGIAHEQNQEVIIRRELLSSGKSRAFVNDQAVQIAFLKKLAPYLIEVSAQHAHIELTSQGAPLTILDTFAENAMHLEAFQKAYKEVLALKKQKADFKEQMASLNRKIQTAEREIEEISAVNPTEGEDDALFSQYTELSKTCESIEQISQLLQILDSSDSSTLSQLSRCKSLIERLSQKNPKFETHCLSFKNAYSDVQEICFELTKAQEASYDAQTQFSQIDARLKELHELKKKYGPTLLDVLAWKEKQKAALKEYGAANVSEDELEEKLIQAETEANKLAKVVSANRQRASQAFSMAVTEELMQLNMPSALFEVELTCQDRTACGDEAVEFFLTPNRGEPKVLIQDAASGGELARLSLAIKCVMMDKNPVGTILFDEIDANIGGQTATVVGKKLAQLGQSCQVLAVSHFAQVAMNANDHFCIAKSEHESRTTSHIQRLTTQDEKQTELNRMLGGNKPLAIFAESA